MADTTAEIEAEPSDRLFDPELWPASPKAYTVIAEVTGQLLSYEKRAGLRRRKRKQDDYGTFHTVATVILCNAIHRYLTEPEGWVSVSLSKERLGRRNRYQPAAMSKILSDLIKRLAAPEMGFLEMQLGHLGYFSDPRLTTIKAGRRLIDLIDEQDLIDGRDFSLGDLEWRRKGEVIILKSSKQGHWDKGELIDYQDDDTTNGYREELHRINDWLAKAKLSFYGLLESGDKVDTKDRHLRRYFCNGSFEQGGRLFAGFWQQLSKPQRSLGLRINGEKVVTLDFGQMAPRTLYGMAGVEQTQEDAYLLPGLEGHRAGVKKVFNAILFADQPLNRLPQGTRALIPRRLGMGDILDLITKVHQPIQSYFFTGIGYQLQFRESEILIDILLTMMERGLVGLPIHDAVVVPRSSAGVVKEIMLDTFRTHVGVDGFVGVED
ncbi:MAG: hypothetical protein HY910_17715 [Desulfarculus sp.]|nr:hypothetical protein [Desulfarculus sp.]